MKTECESQMVEGSGIGGRSEDGVSIVCNELVGLLHAAFPQ